jgi:hypothetical protein
MSKTPNNQFQEYVNSKERATKSNAIEVPSISLPKGVGALKGIDENFTRIIFNQTNDMILMSRKIFFTKRKLLHPFEAKKSPENPDGLIITPIN